MNKKQLIALADSIRSHNATAENCERFSDKQIETLANFCARENPLFKRQRWLDYVAGRCGPNGGPAKA